MTYAFEPELRGTLPRTVVRRPGFPGLFSWPLPFLLPHTAVGVGLIFTFLFFAAYVAFGGEHAGRVVSVTPTTYKGSARWEVAYEYVDGDRRHASRATWAHDPQLEPGSPLTVHALSLFGLEHSEPAELFNPLMLIGVLFFCCFWNGVVFSFHYAFWVRPLLWRRLVRDGQPLKGQLIGKQPGRGRGRLWQLTYRYQSGLEPIEASMMVREPEWQRATVGETVTVLVNPERPKRSVLYAYSPWAASG